MRGRKDRKSINHGKDGMLSILIKYRRSKLIICSCLAILYVIMFLLIISFFIIQLFTTWNFIWIFPTLITYWVYYFASSYLTYKLMNWIENKDEP